MFVRPVAASIAPIEKHSVAVAALYATGRWESGSHTHNGHTRVPIDAEGRLGAFLVNPVWLADAARRETLEEAVSRIDRDLEASIEAFRERGLPAPVAFAYPFSDFGAKPQDPVTAAAARESVSDRFAVQMINSDGLAVSSADARARVLPRVEVPGSWAAEDLFGAVVAALPPNELPEVPFGREGDWELTVAAGVDALSFGDDELEVRVPIGEWDQAVFARRTGRDWANYGLTVGVQGLSPAPDASYGRIEMLFASPSPVTLIVSMSYFRLFGASESFAIRSSTKWP